MNKKENPCAELTNLYDTKCALVTCAPSAEPTLAEFLLATARGTTRPKGKLLVIAGPITDTGLARIILAHDFARLSKATHLRAIVEEWGHLRIMLETYR